MKLMFASLDAGSFENVEDLVHLSKYILLSYYYVRKKEGEKGLIDLMVQRNKEDNFLLDSGAFTLMTSKKGTKNDELGTYVDNYIAFIKKYKIKRYIEMDLDVVIGYDEVLKLRKYLEDEIGYQSVPVWHMSRGTEEFKKMVDDYDYVAIGGLVEHVPQSAYPLIKELVKYANSKGTKVHGLGFTRKDAHEYGFYSVDSSSWTAGRRFGTAVKFRNNKLQAIKKPENTRANYKKVDRNNFVEWCKFQRYVEGKHGKRN